MASQIRVFCEWQFLKEFINNFPIVRNPNDMQLMISWNNLYQLISSADLVINASKGEFVRLCESNSWLFELYKKYNQGELKNLFELDSFTSINDLDSNNLDETYLNAIFLTCSEDNDCIEVSNKYGILALNLNMFKNCNHLYCDSGTSLPRRTEVDWNFLNDLNRGFPQLKNCNSMIVVDKFLFNDTGENFPYEDKIDYNLRPILDCILPESLSEEVMFELTIITGFKRDDYSNAYEYLCSVIEEIRPNLNCVTTMYNDASSIFHDRSIITNYVWIDSGHGFDVAQEEREPNSSTKVTVAFPLIQNNMRSISRSFFTFVDDVNERIRFRPRRRNYGQYCWDGTYSGNRIVSYYTSYEVAETRRNQQAQNRNRPVADRFGRSNSWG